MCLSVCLSAAACPHYCTDPDVTWGNGMGCFLVVHYWVDLQSVHGLRCYGNITRTSNVSEYMPVLALRLVIIFGVMDISSTGRYIPEGAEDGRPMGLGECGAVERRR